MRVLSVVLISESESTNQMPASMRLPSRSRSMEISACPRAPLLASRNCADETSGPNFFRYDCVVSELPQRVERIIVERRLLKDGDALLVAVSGGVDSMVL